MFVTVWTGVLDLTDGSFVYASAGHNAPVLIRDGETEFLKAKNGFVLGGMEGMQYRVSECRMEQGDALFMYTDGVTEASTTANELFGDDRLLACLTGCTDTDAQGILQKVHQAIDGFVKDAEQFDDITMLCFKML